MRMSRYVPLILSLCALAARPAGDGTRTRPLVRPGEHITYAIHSSRFGNIGNATLRVDADTVGSRAAYLLSFDFSARVTLFKVSDRTRSWLDAEGLSTLRYSKNESSPLGGRKEDVRVNSDVATDQPLDELSFIYFIRALDLEPGDSIMVSRHFDPRRNPVRITAIAPRYYEMRVPDSRQKSGTSVLRFLIGDDASRLPLRIESDMPVAGHITMTLVTSR
jgi:hypothetical protein